MIEETMKVDFDGPTETIVVVMSLVAENSVTQFLLMGVRSMRSPSYPCRSCERTWV